MTEVASFGNIVNSLRSVRDDYHEQLKSVPQYEAFLLVESSTEKVAGTLNAMVSSAAPSMATEVVEALELAKAKFRQHLASVPEYRALLAIDKLITEVSTDLGLKTAAVATTPVETATQSDVAEQKAAASEAISPTLERSDDAVSTQSQPAGAQDGSVAIRREVSLELPRDADEIEAMSRLQDALRPDPIAQQPPSADAETAQSSAINESSQTPGAGSDASSSAEPEPPAREEEKAA